LSSDEGFFNVLYLGIFVILSPAFDPRFYHGLKPPHSEAKEWRCAVDHFQSLLHIFSARFFIVLGGEVVSHSYLVDRLLGEFAAASVVLAKAIHKSVENQSNDEIEESTPSSSFKEHLEVILQESRPHVFLYYSRCLDRGHKDFTWTGPNVQILPRSESFSSIILLTAKGEMLDLPSHRIYTEDLDPPNLQIGQIGKRGTEMDGRNLEDERAKKRLRQS
jgi:hypothetical protein